MAGALGQEVLAVIDQQSRDTGDLVEVGDWQIGLTGGGAGDRQGVDRIGLAVAAGGVARVGHELGRDPHDPLAGCEQVGLQATRQVPAVLHRPVRSEPNWSAQRISSRWGALVVPRVVWVASRRQARLPHRLPHRP